MTTYYLWWALYLWFCTDNIKYLHQLSKCCQGRSRCKLIHFRLNDSQNSQCGCLVALIIILILDEKSYTLHSHTSSECSREHVSIQFDYKGSQYNKHRQQHVKLSILHLTVEYQIATRNGETRKQEPEIGPDRYSQTRQILRVEGYRYWFGPLRSSRLNCWTVLEPTWIVYPVQTWTCC